MNKFNFFNYKIRTLSKNYFKVIKIEDSKCVKTLNVY